MAMFHYSLDTKTAAVLVFNKELDFSELHPVPTNLSTERLTDFSFRYIAEYAAIYFDT